MRMGGEVEQSQARESDEAWRMRIHSGCSFFFKWRQKSQKDVLWGGPRALGGTELELRARGNRDSMGKGPFEIRQV